jgi:AcrR family transcriptional regulator
MARGAEDTRRRIFEAATAEFAAHGIAGARVDRIAAAAGANKQLIYAYFGNKRALFEQVVTAQVARFLEEVPFDVADLAGHTVGLYDFFRAQPELVQLGTWHSLEPGETEHRIPVIETTLRTRERAIARAQKNGLLGTTFAAADLLALLVSLARTWAVATPEQEPRAGAGARRLAARRQAVREAAQRLVTP